MDELNDILEQLESLLGPLSGEPRALEGGITNRNYRVTLGGREYVVRRPGKDTDLLGIDRGAELAASEAAAALGLAPEVAGAVADCTVTRFVACVSLGAEEVGAAAEELAVALRSFHGSGLRVSASFDVVDLVDRYAAIVTKRGRAFPPELVRARERAARIREVLDGEPPSPCHNDLLAANVIRERDSGRLMIVDWEYAGMGDPRFDLGNLAVNNDFGEREEDRLLRAYTGAEPADSERAALKLMRVMSDVREAAWGAVQAVISELDFDFAGYAAEHAERLEGSVTGGELETWLATAAA